MNNQRPTEVTAALDAMKMEYPLDHEFIEAYITQLEARTAGTRLPDLETSGGVTREVPARNADVDALAEDIVQHIFNDYREPCPAMEQGVANRITAHMANHGAGH